MATITAQGNHRSNGAAVSGATVKLWDPTAFTVPPTYNSATPGGSPAFGPTSTDADGNWSISSVTAGLYWVSIEDGSTVVWQLSSFEPVATSVTTTPGSGGGSSFSGSLPYDFGGTNHMDVLWTFHSGADIYGIGTDDSTMVLFAPASGGHWDFRRATSTPSGWDGTTVARVDDSGNVLANGGSSTNPGHAFLSEATLGLYRQAAGTIGSTGHLLPSANAAKDLGSTALRWAALWAGAATLASAAIAGVLGLSDGSSGAPSAAFSSEATLGLYRPAAGVIGATGHLRPSVSATHDLGSTGLRWNAIWGTSFQVTNAATVGGVLFLSDGTSSNPGAAFTSEPGLGLYRQASGTIGATGHLKPSASVTYALGDSTHRWNNVYTGGIDASGNGTIGGTLGVTGALSGSSTITAGTGLIATTGGVTAAAGNIVATLGNISATAGSVSAGTTLAAGTSATVGTYLDVTGPLGLGVTHDATKGKLYLLDSTGQQVRVGYDALHYVQVLVDSGGTATVDAPQNAIVLQPGSGSGYLGGVVLPYSSLYTDFGAYNRKVRVLHVGEIQADVLVAQSVLATIGGRIIVAPTSKLFGNLIVGLTTVKLDNYAGTFSAGDTIYLADAPGGVPQYEQITLGTKSGPTTDATTGRVYYTFTGCTRDADHHTAGFNGKAWQDGDAVVNTGGASALGGFIDLTSTAGLYAGSGPAWTVYGRTGTAYNAVKATVAGGNLRGFVDIGSNDYFGLAFGNDLTLTPTTGFRGLVGDANNGSLRLFSVDLKMYGGLGSTQTGEWRASDGRLLVGSNVSSTTTTSFGVFPVSSTFGGETMGAGAVLFGSNASGKANLLWEPTNLFGTGGAGLGFRTGTTARIGVFNSGAIYIYNVAGTAARFILDASNNMSFYDSAGNAVITLDSSGGSYFAGPMTIGTSGGIYQGSGSFASPTTGIKLWAPSGTTGKLGGYNAGTLQWYGDTDGKFYAGAGATVLDANGITLVPTVASTAIKWAATPGAANYYGIVDATTDGTENAFQLASGFPSGSNKNSVLSLTALSSSTTGAATRDVRVQIRSKGSTGSWVEIGSVAAGFKGIIIGDVTGTAPTSGYQIDMSGSLLLGGLIKTGATGLAAPATTTRSAGTRLVLRDTLSGTDVDYAIGEESGIQWYSVATGGEHRFYINTLGGYGMNASVFVCYGTGSASRGIQINNSANSTSFGLQYDNTNTRLQVLFAGAEIGRFSSAGVYTATSDAALKTAPRPFDALATIGVMDRVGLWEWLDPDSRDGVNCWPVAQSMHAAGFGDDPKMLNVGNVAGLALAGVQQLLPRLAAVERDNAELRQMVAALGGRPSRGS